ncbi:glycosyltransferase family 4 protein [Desulforhopalus sp. 52FAK]
MENTQQTSPIRVLVLAGLNSSLINFRGPFIKALCDTGCRVHAAAVDLTKCQDVCVKLEEWGVSCHDIHLQRAGINPIHDLCSVLSLYRLMRVMKPDVVFCYTIKPVIYGTLVAWMVRVPRRFALITGLGYAFTGEITGKRKFVQKLVRKLYSIALVRTEKVFFQNPDDQTLFRQLGLLPAYTPSTVVNGSGIDLIHFQVAPLPEGKVVFLLIARLLGDKGIREYVEAASEVRSRHPNAIFKLVGDVDDNPDSISTQEILKWERDGEIEYMGHLDDVRPAIADCSVYVLPSYREGTPRTVLEAMAMGRPIITTDAPGCRETVVEGSNGLLVPVKKVQELAKAMELFIEDPNLIARMGKCSRKISEEKYNVHKVNAQILQEIGIKC